MKALRLLCAVSCLVCSAADARAALITTFPAWNGSDAGGPFGFPSISTVGQTFKVNGPETLLNNFSVWLNDNGSPVSFKSYLMYWDNTLNLSLIHI